MSEVSLKGIRPAPRFGAWPSLLPQNRKNGCRGLPESTRGKESKAANSVLIAFRNVLRPTINELFQRAPHINPATQFLVLGPKRDGLVPDAGDAALGDGRPPYVPTSVSQEMVFRLEGLDLYAPPTTLLLGKNLFHLVNSNLRLKLTRSQGRA